MDHSDCDMSKLLLVDDIPANLELLISYLGEKYSTAIARNGETALRRAEKYQPDLILLDIQMPGMDGFEVCKRLKESESTRDIPIIFMSARTETTDKLKGFELGGQDYITKPINRYELIARINTHLTLKKIQTELQKRNEDLQNREIQRRRVEKILQHDIKSPLQAIIGIPDLIRSENNLSDEQMELLDMILESADRILEMVNSSLTLYKIENNTYRANFEPVSLVKELEKIVNSGKTASKGQPIALTVENRPVVVSDYSYAVQSEPILLYSLFANLIKNALEASPAGETVHVELSPKESTIEISIRNRGSVPEEIRDSFFEEFVTAGKSHGTGLGTYSAKLITTTLGGTIELDSSREGETSLVVSLPLTTL